MSIQVHGITKTYGTQKALDDISFTLNKGDRPFAKAFTYIDANSVSATGAIGTPLEGNASNC